MNQPDDTPQQAVQDVYDLRQRERRDTVLSPDFAGRGVRNEYPQTAYREDRHSRIREQRVIESGDDTSISGHPLLMGLLQELPGRDSPPSAEWLDRWSATARSILELLYSHEMPRLKPHVSPLSAPRRPRIARGARLALPESGNRRVVAARVPLARSPSARVHTL